MIEWDTSCAENYRVMAQQIEGGVVVEPNLIEPVVGLSPRVGVDLVCVPDVAASIDAFGRAYLDRVYTPTEIAFCTSPDGVVSPARLAARFAAKEAVIKALRPTYGVDYRSIEVVCDAAGAPDIAFASGCASRMVTDAGVTSSSVSLTHDGDYAAAVFLAITDARTSRCVEFTEEAAR